MNFLGGGECDVVLFFIQSEIQLVGVADRLLPADGKVALRRRGDLLVGVGVADDFAVLLGFRFDVRL